MRREERLKKLERDYIKLIELEKELREKKAILMEKIKKEMKTGVMFDRLRLQTVEKVSYDPEKVYNLLGGDIREFFTVVRVSNTELKNNRRTFLKQKMKLQGKKLDEELNKVLDMVVGSKWKEERIIVIK